VGAIDDIADRYVEQWAPLDPVGATFMGVGGQEDRLTDLSPSGFGALADLDRVTLAALAGQAPRDETEQVAKDAMVERLSLNLERYDAGDTISDVNVIASALHGVRSTFDIMGKDDEEGALNVAARLEAVPLALAQWQETLRDAAGRGHVAARRQILEVAKQCAMWVDPFGDNFFPMLAADVGHRIPVVRDRLERAASEARNATEDLGTFLRRDLAPLGREKEAAGRERYELASRYFLGARVDLDETYQWGFDELARIENEMRVVADKILPGATTDEAVAALDADPARNIAGKEHFRDWMQALSDRTVAALDGTHFDIPHQIRRLDCMLAPTSDGGIYYTGPNEDFTRPGRMWWAVPPGVDTFSTWREVTTVFHEGVPGHHLQVAQTYVRAELLNRWRRVLSWSSGHGEGWALYAERLMDELGFLQDAGDKLGMLDGQAFRATRVIIDIGMHLELEIPPDNPFGFHPGERWTPALGWEFLTGHCRLPEENLRFELQRYLGWPGQAPAYKVGERFWLEAREQARLRKGPDFDLRAFHRDALNLGSLGLDPLKDALSRL